MFEMPNAVRHTENAKLDGGAPRVGRREARRRETRAEIVAAAWDVVRENGLGGLAMRELGDRVGMKAQSLYSYFASKHEIYDAMFLEGYLAFEAEVRALEEETAGADLREVAHGAARRFFRFCTSDPARYQLLFQRPIPEFEPSEESYAVAVRVYDALVGRLTANGVTDPDAADLWTATITGFADQQLSNDPGGDRWERLLERAVDMVLREIAPDESETADRARRNPS